MSLQKFEFNDKDLQESFINILDTFTGADGGVKFVLFRNLLENLDNTNSEDSRQVLLTVKRFSKLIDIASRGC